MARKTKTVYRARRTYHTSAWKGPIIEGKDYPPDHPAVKANPSAFDKISIARDDDAPVEQATAAPGEKRPTRSTDE